VESCDATAAKELFAALRVVFGFDGSKLLGHSIFNDNVLHIAAAKGV
jgi:hypothetical protein